MIAKHKLSIFALLAAVIVAAAAADAAAYCSSCGVPAVAAYQPVAYSASYAPVAYTAYRPYTGWYPGYWVDRVRSNLWGAPVAYTAAYYPATYTAGYATTAYYAPSYSYATSYAPACSTCSTCTSCYAPACSTCTSCYAPACSTCATGCSDCAVSSATVTQAVYQEPAAPCTNCAPSHTTSASSTSSAPSTYSAPRDSEPQPALAPSENPPAERSYQETQKPASSNESAPVQPEPASDESAESATNLQAPQLFDPSDRTAERHQAPVWTAVYHKPVSGMTGSVYTVSRQQAEQDAAGWTSASE